MRADAWHSAVTSMPRSVGISFHYQAAFRSSVSEQENPAVDISTRYVVVRWLATAVMFLAQCRAANGMVRCPSRQRRTLRQEVKPQVNTDQRCSSLNGTTVDLRQFW